MPHKGIIRQVMGITIQDTGGQTIQNRLKSPTSMLPNTPTLAGAHIREGIREKMAIDPAPRKNGVFQIGPGGGNNPTGNGKSFVGPPGILGKIRQILFG